MMDQYTKETIQRYKSDLKKFKELNVQIKTSQDEANRVLGRLNAYERIIKDSLGHAGFTELHQELEAAINASSGKKLDLNLDPSSEMGIDALTVTDIILKVVRESGSNGMTAAQVFDAVQSFGIGKEKGSTVYGTLSRLNTSKRIKKFGKRYFSTHDQT
ncbi:MAG: hypothetical protein QOJ70_2452 [Acidobacteriota bacterium]|nr:hypothetical protein [Acidobacteriota bacterium]